MAAICLYAYARTLPAASPVPLNLSLWLLGGLPLLAACSTRLTALLPWVNWRNRMSLIPVTVAALLVWLHLVLAPHTPWTPDALIGVAFAPWRYDPAMNGATLFSAWGVALVLWGLGLGVGATVPHAEPLSKWFIAGICAFLLLFLYFALAPEPASAPTDELEILFVAYLGLSLLVIGLVHRHSLDSRVGSGRISLSWFVALATPVALILAVGLIFTDRLSPAARRALEIAWQGATLFLSLVFTLASWLFYALAVFDSWLTSLFPPAMVQHKTPPPPPKLPVLGDPVARSADSTLPATYVALALALIVLGGLLFVVLHFMFRRRAPEADEYTAEERGSVWSWNLFWTQLQGMWRALVSALRSRLVKPSAHAALRMAGESPDGAHDIRALYRRFLDRMARQGHARAPAATPLEFSRLLGAQFPLDATTIEAITATYADSRYGEIEPAPRLIKAMQELLDNLKAQPDISLHAPSEQSVHGSLSDSTQMANDIAGRSDLEKPDR